MTSTFGAPHRPTSPATALQGMADSIHELRSAGFRQLNALFWSKGQPALGTPIRPRRDRVVDHLGREVDLNKVKVPARAPDAKALSAAELNELRALIATAQVEPSISREVYENFHGTFAEAGCLSLDKAIDTDDGEAGTLHDIVACAERDAEMYGTPYELLDPAIRDRIEWEQQVAQDGTVHGARLRTTHRGLEIFLFPRIEDAAEKKRRTQIATDAWLIANKLDSVPAPSTFDTISRQNRLWKSTALASKIAGIARFTRDAVDTLNAERDEFDVDTHTSTYVTEDGDVLLHHRSPRLHNTRDETWHEEPQSPDEALSTLGIGIAEADSTGEALMGLRPCPACLDGLYDPDEDIPECDNGHLIETSETPHNLEVLERLRGVVLQVTGDRNWTDPEAVRRTILAVSPDILITGCARGADDMAGTIATELGVHVIHMPADWDRHGKAAGPIRNADMVKRSLAAQDLGYQVVVAAFHSDLARSKGTAHMVELCRKAGFPIDVITEENR